MPFIDFPLGETVGLREAACIRSEYKYHSTY